MANEANVKSLILLIAIGILVRSCMSWSGGNLTELQNSTNSTMGEIKSQQQVIVSELTNAANELDGVGKSHERVIGTLKEMSIRLDKQSGTIAECKRIAQDCARLIGENETILCRTGK